MSFHAAQSEAGANGTADGGASATRRGPVPIQTHVCCGFWKGACVAVRAETHAGKLARRLLRNLPVRLLKRLASEVAAIPRRTSGQRAGPTAVHRLGTAPIHRQFWRPIQNRAMQANVWPSTLLIILLETWAAQ